MDYPVATSPRVDVAEQTLKNRFSIGRSQGHSMFNKLKSQIIVDRVATTGNMRFDPSTHKNKNPRYFIRGADGKEHEFTIHNHAFGQMLDCIDVPRHFARKLGEGDMWERVQLASVLMTERFQLKNFNQRGGGKDRFVNRLVNDQVRGFVSRSFACYIGSHHVLNPFANNCAKYGALPISATATDLRFELKMFLPHVFEPVDGEYLAIGASISNSDFGGIAFRISLCIHRIKRGTSAVVEDTMSKPHKGKALDITDGILKKDTIEAEITALQKTIRDIVDVTLHPDSVKRVLKAVQVAADKEIRWDQLKKQLSKVLSEHEVNSMENMLQGGEDETFDLPQLSSTADGEPIPNMFWASSVVAAMAEQEVSGERKLDMQDLAGTLIGTGKRKSAA